MADAATRHHGKSTRFARRLRFAGMAFFLSCVCGTIKMPWTPARRACAGARAGRRRRTQGAGERAAWPASSPRLFLLEMVQGSVAGGVTGVWLLVFGAWL